MTNALTHSRHWYDGAIVPSTSILKGKKANSLSKGISGAINLSLST